MINHPSTIISPKVESMNAWDGGGGGELHCLRNIIESIGHDECSLPLVPFLDLDVVVPPLNIHFGEELCSFQFVNEG